MNLFRTKSITQIQADAAAGLSDHDGTGGLRRTLKEFDLTLMGIAAIVGAGIFAMVGKATYDGGPSVIFLFVFTALACAFAALCYAEFASRIPGAPEVIDENTRIFGSKGFLDSLMLVSAVLDIEQQVNDRYNVSIELADDRSVSQERSPFRSVSSLTDYILTLAAEEKKATQ